MTSSLSRASVCILALLAVAGLASAVRGQNQTTLTVDVGWGDSYRPGTWTPIYLTVTSPAPRQVVAEVYSPNNGPNSMRIWKSFVISPTPTTYAIYVPLPQLYQLSEATVMLRDAASGRRLLDEAVRLADEPGSMSFRSTQEVDTSLIFAGISGQPASGGTIPTEVGIRRVVASYLPTRRLPDVSMGYEGLDVLVLNAPDFVQIDSEQQRAIADWVRGGGCLLIWPGENPMPSSGPIIDLLPCRFGDNQVVTIDPEQLKTAGLQPRFGRHRARLLQPLPGAEAIQLFGGTITGYARTVGFGRTVVLPFNALSLAFDTPEHQANFWLPILQSMISVPPKPADETNTNYYNQIWQIQNRRSAALYRSLDWLGDIPGAGAFGFGYVAVMMLALMTVVGPVDWFILKRLGRQPWTWLTTGGWIGLVTFGAIYAGHVIKSGELHYRSIRLLDQADGTVVAATDLLGLYSPQTRRYAFDFPAEAWVRPAADAQGGRSKRSLNDLVCHQDIRGCRPDDIRVNVWNLRFMQCQTRASTPAVIDATLSLATNESPPRVTGAIINRTDRSLVNLRIRTSGGVATVQETIAPHSTALIDLPLTADATALALPDLGSPEANYNYYYGYQDGTSTINQQPDFKVLSMLVPDRSERIENLLKSTEPKAVIYGEIQGAPAPAALLAEGAIERHLTLVRAVVDLE